MWIRLLSRLALSGLLSACAFSDLRPPELLDTGPTGEPELRGRALLDRAIEVSGGRDAWEHVESAEMRLTDEWRGWVGWFFRPWPENPTQLRMHYDLGMGSARCEFLSEQRRGELWGRDGDRTWSEKPGEERSYRRRESVRFILGAYQYFFELPPRIAEAPIVVYAGHRERAGRQYDLVFAAWDRPEPHAEHDQYLLWIANDTGNEKLHLAVGSRHPLPDVPLGVRSECIPR